jgi:hypothetical protein
MPTNGCFAPIPVIPSKSPLTRSHFVRFSLESLSFNSTLAAKRVPRAELCLSLRRLPCGVVPFDAVPFAKLS